jgi:hypothetical protein
MTATTATQGGQVQLKQSDTRLAVKMSKTATEVLLQAAIPETTYQIKKPRTEGQEEKKWGVELHGHNTVKAAIDTHPAMLWQTHMSRCLPCQNSTT